MKVPFLLAWLSGLAPYRLKNERLLEEALKKDQICPALPPLEVLPSQAAKTKSFVADTIRLEGGLTLLKGRVSTADLCAENAAGNFEGGLRLSKCAVELINTLRREIQDGQLSFRGKRVLELGCGHGLPGFFACMKGASVVHFQDISVEVLKNLTIPNVAANLEHTQSQHAPLNDAGQVAAKTSQQLRPELHYYAGDWSGMDSVLSLARRDDTDSTCECDDIEASRRSEGDSTASSIRQGESDASVRKSCGSLTTSKRMLSGSRACERGNVSGSLEGGYDIILMSETVYAAISLPKLYNLIMKCLRPRYGVVYLAGKKHYYGSGGGTRQFKSIADDDGILGAHLVTDFTDTSFNTKEVWKFFFH
eukprot:c11065_g1_i1 orf=288-1379(+)